MYLQYDEYIKLTNDTIEEIDYNNLYREMSRKINFYTFNRIDFEDEYLLELFQCCIAEMILLKNTNAKLLNDKDNNLASETVDQYSRTYTNKSDTIKERIQSENRAIEQLIREYFLHTNLMYRGV